MFVAFLLRNPDVRPDSSFGPGVMIGDRGRRRRPGPRRSAPSPPRRCAGSPRPLAVVLALLGDAAAALLAALFYGVWTLALLGLVAGLAQALAKFSLDATIQRDIPTQVQASAFGRSDTTCQLAWVLGGFVGHRAPARPAPARPHRRVRGPRRLDGLRPRDRAARPPAPPARRAGARPPGRHRHPADAGRSGGPESG